MTRKDFLKALGCAGMFAVSARTHATEQNAPSFRAKRAITEYVGELEFPPEAVFPLLCPVREFDWLNGWNCQMIYSDSGVAEENCIFTTAFGSRSVWNVDRYEPPSRIEFTVVSPDQVTRLNLRLQKTTSGGTTLKWQRTFTALTEAGNAHIHDWKIERDRSLTEAIDYFLKTGKTMPNA